MQLVNEFTVDAPMVGTFYRAPAPGEAPFVEVGQTIEGETVLCIIEVMKLMNSISARRKGRVKRILVEDGEPVGFLDYKLDYPEPGDATVNLLLIPEAIQSRGYGRRSIGLLEAGLQGRARRVLASIYGSNARAKRFWRGLGYRFAIDARPVLEWYAKEL